MRAGSSPWASYYFIDIYEELPRYHASLVASESGSGQ